MFSPQKKASFQQKITGNLSDTHRRELGEMDRKIKSAKEEQEYYQKEIDKWKQYLQDTSQQQDKGRTHVCWHQSGHVLLVIVTSSFLPLAL